MFAIDIYSYVPFKITATLDDSYRSMEQMDESYELQVCDKSSLKNGAKAVSHEC